MQSEYKYFPYSTHFATAIKMPSMDTVFYTSNHKQPTVTKVPPVVISQSRLKDIQTRAHPVLSKITEEHKIANQLSQQETIQQQQSIDRAKNWETGEFGNEEVRLQRLAAHKQKLFDNTKEMAQSYKNRQALGQEELLKRQNAKISDQSEYTRYLKTAKQSAVVAQYENFAKVEKARKAEEYKQEQQDFKRFIYQAAENEKQFKSKILGKFRTRCIECADYNKSQIECQTLEKETINLQTIEDGEDAKTIHNAHLRKVEEEKETRRQKMLETKAYYEESLALEKEVKEQRKVFVKAEILEEKITEATKDAMFDYAKNRQQEFIQKKVAFQQAQQDKAQITIKKAQEAREGRLHSMDLDTIDGERKRQQLQNWTSHWNDVNYECRLTQELQHAERNANSVTQKLAEIKDDVHMIHEAELEKEIKRQKAIEAKQKGLLYGQALQNDISLKNQREATLKKEVVDFERTDIDSKMDQFVNEQIKCREAAMAESDENVKKAYLQVVKRMDKQLTGVTWHTDIH